MPNIHSLTVATSASPRKSPVSGTSGGNLVLRSPTHLPSVSPGGNDPSRRGPTKPKPADVTPGGDPRLRTLVSPGGKNLTHRTLVSSNVEYPLGSDVVHGKLQEKLEACPYAFRAPTSDDKRAPCPALNTLANHGYL